MRESIKTIETYGKLELENGYTEENVKCIFKDDFYSNKIKEGEFEINGFTMEFEKNFKHGIKFDFKDINGRKLSGRIWGFNLHTELNIRKDALMFNLDEHLQWLSYGELPTHRIKISYRIPYVNLFSRGIIPSFGFSDEYIHKFTTKPIKLRVYGYELSFEENVYLIKYNEPDSIFSRNIYPTIEFVIKDEAKHVDILNELEQIVDKTMVLISFILFHRVNSFGYDVDFYDEEGNGTGIINYKNFRKGVCEDYIEDTYRRNLKFTKYFTEDNLSMLINRFIEKDLLINGQLIRILNLFISISEIKIFEPMFLSSFFVLEAVSKIIVKPNKQMKSEELIKKAMEIACSGSNIINFRVSPNRIKNSNSELEWLISEYRNMLTHFNDVKFDNDEIYEEYKKIMRLSRRLILYYIEPAIMDFPFPKDSD